MKDPITRRLDRRILAALRACGPLTELELEEFLNLPLRRLSNSLIKLASTGQITCVRRQNLLGQQLRTWSMAAQKGTDE